MSNDFYKTGFWVSTILCVIMLVFGLSVYNEVKKFERKLEAAQETLTSYKQALAISDDRFNRLTLAIKSSLGNTTLKRLLDFINRTEK